MPNLSANAIKKLQKQMEKEFPGDPALRLIHVARKILAHEAAESGMTYLEYVNHLAQTGATMKTPGTAKAIAGVRRRHT